MKTYWFYFEPTVFVSLKSNRLLLYDTVTGKILEYGEPRILRFVRKLVSPANRGVVAIHDAVLNDPVLGPFIGEVREHFMADVIDTSYSNQKPVRIIAEPIVEYNAGRLRHDPCPSIGEEFTGTLHTIYVYINNTCSQSCTMCGYAYRQFPSCTTSRKKREKRQELDISLIDKMLDELGPDSMVRWHILGGNPFDYSMFAELLKRMKHMRVAVAFYCHYMNLWENEKKLDQLSGAGVVIKLVVTFPLDKKKLSDGIAMLREREMTFDILFPITSDGDFISAGEIVSDMGIKKYEYHPLYTGENFEFFRDVVYIGREDLYEMQLSFKEIYRNRLMNMHYFGRLLIFSDGAIRARINGRVLGNINQISLYDAVIKELKEGESWLRVREKRMPCRDCVFDALCPPLSNYNDIFGVNNCCTVFP